MLEAQKENLNINKLIAEKKEIIFAESDMIVPDTKPDILSTISTLVMTLLAIAYSLTWGILFLFYIEKTKKSNDTVTRTIRISGEAFDKISDLAEKNELSFNSVVNQIIEFGLKNLEE